MSAVVVWSQDVIRREKSDVGEPPEWDVCGSVVNARRMAAERDMNM